VWSRSCHAKKVDVALNETCHLIIGCLKSTPIPLVQILSGIAPPNIRRSAASDAQKTAQANNERHPLHGYQPRKNFLKSTQEITTSLKYERYQRWIALNQTNNFKIKPMEKLLTRYRCEWNTCKTLNRLRVGVVRTKKSM
jgi:hypothetical protein